MPDVLVHFDEPQLSADGRMFTAQVMGSRLPTGLWEAWIEFHPRIGGDPVRTPRQTEQLSRGDLRFWAAGITRAHLQSALGDALSSAKSAFTGSESAGDLSAADASASGEDPVGVPSQRRRDEPALDPAAIYARSGEYALRQELRALDAGQLAAIISAYDIADMDVIDLARTYEDALAERIVAGVQHNVDAVPTNSVGAEARAAK